jgi:branched-chain amino acid transport system permease protein
MSSTISRLSSLRTLIAPCALLVLVGLIGTTTSLAKQQYFISALIAAVIVIGLYTFIGNSGVISFGHISFVALGAFSAGELTIPSQLKHLTMPGLWSFIANHSASNTMSLVVAAGLGGVYALAVGLPLMRLSGLAAGIATFAVLEITHNLLEFWTKIGPGAQTLSLVPASTGLLVATIGALIAAVVAFAYQSSRRGRRLRASREDAAAAQAIGVNIYRERLVAFTISGAICGLAGGLLVHQLASVTTEQVYLELTFLTLAMLVVGGWRSLWGATLGAILVSLLASYLNQAVNGLGLGLFTLTLPSGTSDLILGVLMTAMLLFKPNGISGGRELTGPPRFLQRLRRGRADAGTEPQPGAAALTHGQPAPAQVEEVEPR